MSWYGTTAAGVRAAKAVKAKRRQAREASAPRDGVCIDRRAIWERHGGRCHLCKRRVPFEKMTLDHKTPLAKGGAHTDENLAPAHAGCNSEKRDRVGPKVKRKGLRRTAFKPKARPKPAAEEGVF